MKQKIATSKDSLLHPNSDHGINVITACLFIVGEIAGSGVLALPEAMKMTGWLGVFVMIIVCTVSAYSGVLLGRSWILLEDADDSLKNVTTRNPYPLIGERAWGSIGKTISVISQVIQLYGGSIVSLLLSAEMMQSLFTPIFPSLLTHISFCEWIVIMAIFLLPFSFFGSPVDFWPIAFFAMSSTAIASVLIVIVILTQDQHGLVLTPSLDETTSASSPSTSSSSFAVSAGSVLLGIGSMNFAFSGASCMPTIQNDMKNKRRFGTAVVLAYIILMMIYLPVSVVGYQFFGNDIKSSVIRNLTPSPLVKVIEVLIAVHVLCSYLILLNPVNLNVENVMGISHCKYL
jgi:vesicular inhibitory amino acid transporter